MRIVWFCLAVGNLGKGFWVALDLGKNLSKIQFGMSLILGLEVNFGYFLIAWIFNFALALSKGSRCSKLSLEILSFQTFQVLSGINSYEASLYEVLPRI